MRRDSVFAKIKNIDSALDKREEPPLLVVLHAPPEEYELEGAFVGLESGIIFDGELMEVEDMISVAGGRVIATMQYRVHT